MRQVGDLYLSLNRTRLDLETDFAKNNAHICKQDFLNMYVTRANHVQFCEIVKANGKNTSSPLYAGMPFCADITTISNQIYGKHPLS